MHWVRLLACKPRTSACAACVCAISGRASACAEAATDTQDLEHIHQSQWHLHARTRQPAANICLCAQTNACTRSCTCICSCRHSNTHMHMYACKRTYAHACTQTHACTHTHNRHAPSCWRTQTEVRMLTKKVPPPTHTHRRTQQSKSPAALATPELLRPDRRSLLSRSRGVQKGGAEKVSCKVADELGGTTPRAGCTDSRLPGASPASPRGQGEGQGGRARA